MTKRKNKIAAERERLLPKDLTDEAVADYWAYEGPTELHDAALLLEGIEPRPDRGTLLRKFLRGYDERYAQDYDTTGEDEAQFVRLARIVRRAREAGDGYPHQDGYLDLRVESDRDRTEHEIVGLREFLTWAKRKGYDPPPALAKLIDEQPQATKQRPTTKNATKASATARRTRNAERDRRIHEAAAAGKEPKQIGTDRSIVGDKNLSPSRVRDILRAPKP